jgi:hypothetical protein
LRKLPLKRVYFFMPLLLQSYFRQNGFDIFFRLTLTGTREQKNGLKHY